MSHESDSLLEVSSIIFIWGGPNLIKSILVKSDSPQVGQVIFSCGEAVNSSGAQDSLKNVVHQVSELWKHALNKSLIPERYVLEVNFGGL